MKKKLTYKSSGVDISAGDRATEKIKRLAKSTFTPGVLRGIGSFGGFFALKKSEYKSPVLLSSVDSVGTKLKVAFMMRKHDTVGEDIVNHCINDILVHGAKPLFFLDYIGIGELRPEVVAEVVKGLSRGCKKAGCALIGGETAELPEFYKKGDTPERVFTATNVQEIDGVVTATLRKMENLKKKQHTTVEFSGIKYNVGVKEDIFSERYLKNPPREYIK